MKNRTTSPPNQSRVKELARQNTVESVNALAAIMEDTKAEDEARLLAAKTILDLGWGKPEQRIECSISGASGD